MGIVKKMKPEECECRVSEEGVEYIRAPYYNGVSYSVGVFFTDPDNPRILAYQSSITDGQEPISLFWNEIMDFVSDARQKVKQQREYLSVT